MYTCNRMYRNYRSESHQTNCASSTEIINATKEIPFEPLEL